MYIVECYTRCNQNTVQAAQEYYERYFERRQSYLPAFKRLYDNLGFSKSKDTSNQKNEVVETNMLACVFQTQSVYTRQVAADTEHRSVLL